MGPVPLTRRWCTYGLGADPGARAIRAAAATAGYASPNVWCVRPQQDHPVVTRGEGEGRVPEGARLGSRPGMARRGLPVPAHRPEGMSSKAEPVMRHRLECGSPCRVEHRGPEHPRRALHRQHEAPRHARHAMHGRSAPHRPSGRRTRPSSAPASAGGFPGSSRS